MENPDYKLVQDVPTEPNWHNTPRRCVYTSAIGIELGFVQMGEGLGRHMWFAYLNGREDALGPSTGNREQAKRQVETALEINSGFITIPDSLEIPDEEDEQ